jgi:hypothetical protein
MDLTSERHEQAARDLELAYAVVDSEGWIRHRLSSPDGRCLQGAVWKGAGNDLDRVTVALVSLREYLRRAYAAELKGRPTDGLSAVHYVNDHLLRDKEDALDVLAKAAVAAREGVG